MLMWYAKKLQIFLLVLLCKNCLSSVNRHSRSDVVCCKATPSKRHCVCQWTQLCAAWFARGMSILIAIFVLLAPAAAKSVITHKTAKAKKVLKMDFALVIYVKKKANITEDEKLTNQHFFSKVWMLCSNVKVHYFHIFHLWNQIFHHLRKFAKQT